MAYKVVLYSIESSVGQGGFNKPDDVMLVQALVTANATVTDFAPAAAELGVKLSPVTLTGACSENLINWIKVAQKRLCGHHHPDGLANKTELIGPGSMGTNKSGTVKHVFGALLVNAASLNMAEYRKIEGKVTLRQEYA